MSKELEVCLSPKLFDEVKLDSPYTTVIIDIFRATTSIVAALGAGVKEIIPVLGLEEARKYKDKGYVVAAEREGIVPDFADIGNSAFDFFTPKVKGSSVAYSTTNGTKIVHMASDKSDDIVIASFLNLKAVAKYLAKQNQNILLFCAGYKNSVNLEDTLFAGALVEELLRYDFSIHCDSAWASHDLWQFAKSDLLAYIDKSSHRYRLRHLVSQELVEYTFKLNELDIVPVLNGNRIVLV
ncbi:MAG: 2-phosphosulfolactate phosphatase [Bacteroidales bacterium]